MSDFDKDVAKEIRALKKHFNMTRIIGRTPEKIAAGEVDPSVAEQVEADLDSLAEKRESKQ